MPDMTPGQTAYEAYCKNSGGISLVTGDGLPGWSALPPRIREAWEAAVPPRIREAWEAAAYAVIMGENI